MESKMDWTKKREQILEKFMLKNFSNLVKKINLPFQVTHQIANRKNTEKTKLTVWFN